MIGRLCVSDIVSVKYKKAIPFCLNRESGQECYFIWKSTLEGRNSLPFRSYRVGAGKLLSESLTCPHLSLQTQLYWNRAALACLQLPLAVSVLQ